MDERLHWVEREILDAYYNISLDFRSGAIDENTLKERILQAARRYERALGTEAEMGGRSDLTWKV
jgi:hypothetical protein